MSQSITRPAKPDPPTRIVLASASPRRREILTRAGVEFAALAAHIPERVRSGESPTAFVERIAREKALAVATRLPADEPARVLAADTIVVLEGAILGKPKDAREAVQQLERLVGKQHTVWSGVAVLETASGTLASCVVASRVQMRRASRTEIRAYVAGGEPLDKAGSYALQGEGGRLFVTAVEGSRSNVIGLPLQETLDLLARAEQTAGVRGTRPRSASEGTERAEESQ